MEFLIWDLLSESLLAQTDTCFHLPASPGK
jgi:hypothetical protein